MERVKLKRASARCRRLLLLFSITDQEYDKVFKEQNKVCAGCGRPPMAVRLSVDHRHKDGLVRGLLCMRCNKTLALVLDDSETLHRLANYLYKPPAVAVLGLRMGRIGRVTRRWKTKRERNLALELLKVRLKELGYAA